MVPNFIVAVRSRMAPIVSIALVFPLSLWMVPANANDRSCDNPNEIFLELEDAKSDFLVGNYEDFLSFIDTATARDEASEKAQLQLEQTFPNGFEGCSTIVTEVISDNLFRELVAFKVSDGGLYYLIWDVIRFDGSWSIIFWRLEGSYGEVAKIWH